MDMSDLRGVSFMIEALDQAGAAAQVSAILGRDVPCHSDLRHRQALDWGASDGVAGRGCWSAS